MKTKITLALLMLFALSSCINDYYGHPDDKDGILTESNYFYSDDFKTAYLEIRLDSLDVEIKQLEAIVSDGEADSIQIENLELARIERENAIAQTAEIAANRDIVYKRRPRIPSPCPKDENCYPNLQYIAVVPGIDFSMVVVDTDGELVGQTEGVTFPLDNVDGLINAVVFTNYRPDFMGDVQIQIKETLVNTEETFEYALGDTIGQ